MKRIITLLFVLTSMYGSAQFDKQFVLQQFTEDTTTFDWQFNSNNQQVTIWTMTDTSTWHLTKTSRMFFHRFKTLDEGTPGRLMWIASDGMLHVTQFSSLLIPYSQITGTKRQETYSGTTDGSGTYSVTFSVPYSVAPNIQVNIIGATNTQFHRTVSVTTTGFSVLVGERIDSVSSLPTFSNVSGAAVDVLVTEK